MKISKFITLLLFSLFLFSCEKTNEDIFNAVFTKGELGTTEITSITNVRDTTTTLNCVLTFKGKGYLLARGVCWSTTQHPTIDNGHVTVKDTGTVTLKMSKLSPGTLYYVRPFITNNEGTAYGNELNFTTKTIPTLTIAASPTNLTAVSATITGTVTSDGGDSVTVRGVCWGTSLKPTIALTTKTNNGAGKGIFNADLSGLVIGTTYYARAYATNAYGTVYSSEISFTTQNLPTLSTTAVSNITTITATSGGTISNDGGSTILARGVCWSTNQNPTIDLTTKTNEGIGIGSFSSTLVNLQINTTYYVRAYATNALGTSYGAQQTFTTNGYATITTNAVSAITSSTATCGGNISLSGGSSITARGVCWSTSTNPTITNSKTLDATGTGTFTSSITGLSPGTTYYVRAYATNTAGTQYGSNVNFTTNSVLPTISTTTISGITTSSAASGGNITSDGGSTVIAKGVCWSTSSTPTTSNSKTSDGTGVGAYTSSMSGLAASTTYYIRAYATNSVGTSYGSQLSFLTSAILLPTLTTTAVSGITTSSATSGGNVIADGGATIIARGVCWSTSSTPTISNSKTSDGMGIGTFTSSITGLYDGTTYYVRAYATNSAGTNYGTEVSFKTNNLTVTDIDGNVYHTITIGTQTWMVENLKTTTYNDGAAIPNVTDDTAWKALTTPAYCWYNNDAATFKNTYGALYNWYAVNTGKLAPIGWHVPSDAEWTTLTDYLGGGNVAGGKLKEIGTTHWLSPNYGATNEIGFSALPGGRREGYWDGAFSTLGEDGGWWCETEFSTWNAWYRNMFNLNSAVGRSNYYKYNGFSVRCVRDY
ncbi:MAG: FISUMP domain-containing protein [Paludibacter sp.]